MLIFLLTRPSRDVTGAVHQHHKTEIPFLLTRPSRDVTSEGGKMISDIIFLLTRPSRDVTTPALPPLFKLPISTHTPLAGRDIDCIVRNILPCPFLLTRPSRDVTEALDKLDQILKISTHTPLAGRDDVSKYINNLLIISTHTPLAGRDESCTEGKEKEKYFYSHVPRGT